MRTGHSRTSWSWHVHMDCFEGNTDRVDREPGVRGSSEDKNDLVNPAGIMAENPVSFVVGDPDADPNEELEIEDSFPDEGSDLSFLQPPQNVIPGLVERRKRLRWFFHNFFFFFSFCIILPAEFKQVHLETK